MMINIDYVGRSYPATVPSHTATKRVILLVQVIGVCVLINTLIINNYNYHSIAAHEYQILHSTNDLE